MQPAALARLASMAGLVGGVGWTIKAATVILTAYEPPVFWVGPPLFLVATAALALLAGAGRLQTASLVLSGIAAAGMVGVALTLTIFPEHAPANDERLSLGGVLLAASTVATLAALLLAGIRLRTANGPRQAWRTLPAAIALGAVPLTVGFGGIAAVSAPSMALRIVEVPILTIGVAWIVFSTLLWKSQANDSGDAKGPAPA